MSCDDHVVARERGADDARVAVQERAHRVEEVRDACATPRSNAAFACSAVASLWPSETVTPRSSSRVDQRVGARAARARASSAGPGPPSSSRSSSARSGSRRADATCVPSRRGERNGPSRCTPRIRGSRVVGRHLAQRGEQLLLGRGDQRRQVGGDAGLEQRLARAAVAVGVGVEEVDAAEAVHLEVDEARDGEAAPVRRRRGRSATIRPSTTSTSPPTNRPSTSAASTPSLTSPRSCDSLRAVAAVGQYHFRRILVVRRAGLYHRGPTMAEHPPRARDARRSAASSPSTTSRSRSPTASSSSSSGPSGCGKSTLLRMIAGPRGGHRRARSRSATATSPTSRRRSRDIAMVFQTYALYPHMTRAPEPRLRPEGAAHAEGRDRAAGRRGRRAARPRRPARPPAGAALRRPAPARRDGPRDRARAAGVPARRAALEPRREAPRRHARVARAAAPAARRHDRLRHARPGRGDDARPARRGDARRAASSRSTRRSGSTSEPRDLFVAGVHRLAGDEPRRGDGRGRRRALRPVPRAARRRPPPAPTGRVVLGIRPESFEDAAFAPGLPTIEVARRGARGARLRRPRLLHRRRAADHRRGARSGCDDGAAARRRRRALHRARRRRAPRARVGERARARGRPRAASSSSIPTTGRAPRAAPPARRELASVAA